MDRLKGSKGIKKGRKKPENNRLFAILTCCDDWIFFCAHGLMSYEQQTY